MRFHSYLLLSLFVTFALPELVSTPLGLRPRECVHQLGNHAHVIPMEGGVKVEYPNSLEDIFLPELPQCVENMQMIISNLTQGRSMPRAPDGWLDNVGFSTSSIGSFTGTYTVPTGSPSHHNNQFLYYFIGIDNMSGTITILQPVLSYNPNTGTTGWYFASWNCCPSGQTHEGPEIHGIKTGDNSLLGSIHVTSSSASIISQGNGQTSNLTVATNGRVFNWADVTLEVYSVASCSDYATGPAIFSNLKMADINGSPLNYVWNDPGPTPTECSGRTTVSGATVTIQHN